MTPPAAVDPRTFRGVMGRFATGVAIVTTRAADGPHGMTVNSLTSVSLEPTLVLVCLTRDSRTAAAVIETGAFAVNFLTTDQMSVSNRFARAGEDHFADAAVEISPEGPPLLRGSLAFLLCDVHATHDGGDHVIVVGRVLRCEDGGGQPLLFYRGKYARHIAYDDHPAPHWWG